MDPLVTVYITNYNYAAYIEQAIESVLAQTFQDFELIIIDDGSTDGSRHIIERYTGRPNIRAIYQQNKGLNATNNVAIRAARGKYLMRLDADDFLERPALGVMVSLLEADPELGLVFPDYYYVDEHNNRTGQERRHHFDDEVTLYDQPAHGACTMVRLGFLKALGGYDESFDCQDGYELWIKFINFHKVTNISRPLFSYRRHSSNLTGNLHRILTTRKRIKQRFVEQYLEPTTALMIIPVRTQMIGSVNWPLYEYAGKTVVEHRVAACAACSEVAEIVVTTAEADLLDVLTEKLADQPKVRVL
ncbi:MAG: glycosyltransferase, partial [Bacteroidetes bacterium]